jgi:DNA-binding transcriptional LysR family regulator
VNALLAEDLSMPRFLDSETREATKEAVACGLGIAPLLRLEVGEDKRWVMVAMAPPAPGVDEYVACRPDPAWTPLIRAFLDVASNISVAFEASRQPRRAGAA